MPVVLLPGSSFRQCVATTDSARVRSFSLIVNGNMRQTAARPFFKSSLALASWHGSSGAPLLEITKTICVVPLPRYRGRSLFRGKVGLAHALPACRARQMPALPQQGVLTGDRATAWPAQPSVS